MSHFQTMVPYSVWTPNLESCYTPANIPSEKKGPYFETTMFVGSKTQRRPDIDLK